ncbi:hypothetical protein R3P38DRAFT_1721110 [Favolaschia claudopus]|uniref:Uncharacterized protein n=1 Tax=Favolaschia claudopus TaxID=2862362 RepID=A0AAW0AAM2_9AGAR
MASVSPTDENINKMAKTVMYYMLGLVGQTFFFGIYSILIFMSTRMLLQRKLKSKTNKTMFAITVSSYILTLAYWSYNIADGVGRMHQYNDLALNPSKIEPNHTEITKWSPLFNALTLINYVVGDGVVVWRAWVICQRNHRKYLSFTFFFLGVTTITAILTIAFRIADLAESPSLKGDVLALGIDILQVTNLATSLLSNLTATGVVAATAWKHWKLIRSAFSEDKANSLRTNRILVLLIETGFLYCISALVALCAAFIRLPHGTLGDLYQPVNIEIAGAYPTVVLLLVSTQKSLNESSFVNDDFSNSTSRPAPLEDIRFAANSGTQSSVVSRTISFARNPLSTGTYSSVAEPEIPSDSGSIRPEKGGDPDASLV